MLRVVTSSDIHGTRYDVATDELIWRPAAYAIVVNDGKLLLTRQHNKLHLPGGGVELGEMPEDAAVREVWEETGLEVATPLLIGSISGFFTYTRGEDTVHVQSILLYYRCEFVGGEFSIDGFEEDEKFIGDMPEWLPLQQLDAIDAGSTIDWRSVVKETLQL